MDTINIRPPLWLPIIVVLIGGAFYVHGKNIEVGSAGRQPVIISVSAEAKVSAPPDIAHLSFGIQTGRQPTAKAAIAMIEKNMQNIIDAAKKAGVAEKDLTTESFWLNPAYDYSNGTQVPRGFEAGQSLRVKVRDLDKVGDVLTAATAAGANNAGGISFEIDEPEQLQAEAREMAVKKAKAKAEVLAGSLGMHIVKLTGFSEGGGGYPQPMYMKTMDSYGVGGGAEARPSLVVPTGEQDVTSQVTLTYEVR